MKEKILWIAVLISLLSNMVGLAVYDHYIVQKKMSEASKKAYEKSHKDAEQMNMDKQYKLNPYLSQDDNYYILAIGKEGNLKEGGEVHIYAETNEDSIILAELQYNCAVLVCREFLEKDTEYYWLPVDLPNQNCIGYVKTSQIELQSVKVKHATEDKVRNQILEEAISYIGLKFVPYGKSLQTGIDCSNYIQQIYAKAGVTIENRPNDMKAQSQIVTENEALPGDIVYYDANSGGGHVGIYIGEGLIINSAGHDGRVYPEGGVRICRLKYHDREKYEFCKIIQ